MELRAEVKVRRLANLLGSKIEIFVDLELQGLMQHKSLKTTQGYVNMANKLNRAVSALFVPKLTAESGNPKSACDGTKMEQPISGTSNLTQVLMQSNGAAGIRTQNQRIMSPLL